jgi:hypothetical protein
VLGDSQKALEPALGGTIWILISLSILLLLCKLRVHMETKKTFCLSQQVKAAWNAWGTTIFIYFLPKHLPLPLKPPNKESAEDETR